jgi:hypothetical protein
MNRDTGSCHVGWATQPTSDAPSPGVRPWSDKTLLGSLLTGVNLLLFALIQSGNLGFEKGDFKMFYTAAVALRTGRASDIYNPDIYAPMQRQAIPSLPLASVKPYIHPPYELLVVLPFSFVSYKVACWW